MRLIWVAMIPGMTIAGSASASSFVHLPATDASKARSIVHIAAPAAAAVAPRRVEGLVALSYPSQAPAELVDPMRRISASVVAYGEPPLPQIVEDIKVAAVHTPTRPPSFSPMVIRGGLFGHAFERDAPAELAAGTEQAPARQQASAAPAGDRGHAPAPETPTEPEYVPSPPPSRRAE